MFHRPLDTLGAWTACASIPASSAAALSTKIPADLVEHYGKTETVESLKTKDSKEALRAVRKRSEEQEQEFDRIRAGRQITALTDEQIDALAEDHFTSAVSWDDWQRQRGLTEEAYESLQNGLDEFDSEYRWGLATGDISQVEHLVSVILKQHGIAIAKGSRDFQRLGYALLKAVVRANEVIQARQHGTLIDTPPLRPVDLGVPNRRSPEEHTLDDVLAKWAFERKPRAKSLDEWKAVVRKFNDKHGDIALRDIEKKHVVAYKDMLLEAAKAPGTLRKQLGALHSLFAYAVDNGMCEKNPATGVRYQGPKVAPRTRQHTWDDMERHYGKSLVSG